MLSPAAPTGARAFAVEADAVDFLRRALRHHDASLLIRQDGAGGAGL
jgi:hypothetical protein